MKLILAGAGVKEGDLSLRAYEEIKKADKVFIRTAETNVGRWLASLGFEFTALDYIYKKSRNFYTLAKNLANVVLKAAKSAAGSASDWNTYQPKEPAMLKTIAKT